MNYKIHYLFFFFLIFPIASSAGQTLLEIDYIWWELKDADRRHYRYSETYQNWKEERKGRELRKIARGQSKTLALRWGRFPQYGNVSGNSDAANNINKVDVWVKDPNGIFSKLKFSRKEEGLLVELPDDLLLNGRYLIGAHINVRKIDAGSGKRTADIHLYAKCFVIHHNKEGSAGNKPDIFINASDKIAFEIAPLIKRPHSYYRGATQRPYNEYEMQVLYRGKPLANARVTVATEGGWRKDISTNASGIFVITPMENHITNRYWEEYLYAAFYYDAFREEYHCATLPMTVYRSRPEWQSMSRGFFLWASIGAVIVIIIVMGMIYRKRRRDRLTIVKFDEQTFKRI